MRLTVLALPLVAAACSPSESRTQAAVAGDTTVIDIRGPTLLAHFPTTQAEVDASEDGGEALGDFQYHLGRARDSLIRLGIVLEALYTPTLQYRLTGRVTRFAPPADSGVAYLFVAPDRAPRTYYGVLTNEDLLDLAHRFVSGAPEP